MVALAFFTLVVSLSARALAQCTSNEIIPDWYGTSEVVYVGDRLFDAVINSNQCTPSSLITGDVYLYRPGDASFIPQKVGYWNGLNASDPRNTINAPNVHPKGYGYRVVIVPDRRSPAREPQHSNTFVLISQEWLDQSYDQVFLWEPTSAYDDTKWSSTGQQLLAWDDSNTNFNSFDVLLYKSTDVTWGPLFLTHVDGAACPNYSCATTEYYFTYPGKLPEGPGYQVVFQTSKDKKAEVLAVSGLIDIVDYPVETNTFPFTWTPIKTLSSQPTGK